MIEISSDLIFGKKVLLRYDLDVPIRNGKVVEDFRLKAGLPTLRLCLENADQVIMMGHIGRPGGREVPELSVEPIYDWLYSQVDLRSHMESGKLKLLENLRFEVGEEACSEAYAREILKRVEYASLRSQDDGEDGGMFYVNEAVAAHHSSASTTILPTFLPHAVGLKFAEEVRVLKDLKENAKRPKVAIIGGKKIEDKYPAVVGLSSFFEHILVGGLLAQEIREKHLEIADNVILGEANDNGIDISDQTTQEFEEKIMESKTVFWAGPVGKYEDPAGNHGNQRLAGKIASLNMDSFICGGDTIAATKGFQDKFTHILVGGGASTEYLVKDTLPTIDVLK